MAEHTEMARMLSVLNGGEVARKLGVSRSAVSEWSRASDPPPARVAQVRELLLTALGQQERAGPDWDRLMRQSTAACSSLTPLPSKHSFRHQLTEAKRIRWRMA
jgi:transcriptional regulator with XRE-family HTH domain